MGGRVHLTGTTSTIFTKFTFSLLILFNTIRHTRTIAALGACCDSGGGSHPVEASAHCVVLRAARNTTLNSKGGLREGNRTRCVISATNGVCHVVSEGHVTERYNESV